MKYFKFLVVGFFFGIVLVRSELISWYRWQETFLLHGFHVVGILFTAVLTGIICIQLIKRKQIKDISGCAITLQDKNISFTRYMMGGLLFGAGWALVGCPGAQYALIGQGYFSMLLVLGSAVLGAFLYGLMRNCLPH